MAVAVAETDMLALRDPRAIEDALAEIVGSAAAMPSGDAEPDLTHYPRPRRPDGLESP